MKKLLALILALVMALMCTAAFADDVGEPFEKEVFFTMLNSKPEITKALQAAADQFGAIYKVKIEVVETSNPGDEISKRYNGGEAPTISVLDIAQVKDLAREGKIIDLGGEPWAEVGGRDLGAVINDVLYGMPLTIESKANLLNKTAIEKITGEPFDPLKYVTLEDFKALLEQLTQVETFVKGVHAYTGGVDQAAAGAKELAAGAATLHDEGTDTLRTGILGAEKQAADALLPILNNQLSTAVRVFEETGAQVQSCGYDLRPECMKTVTLYVIRTDL